MVVKHSQCQIIYLRRPGRAGIEGIAYCLKGMLLEVADPIARHGCPYNKFPCWASWLIKM